MSVKCLSCFQTPTSSGTTPAKAKPVKKIRRDASFRQLFHSKSSAPKVPPVSSNSTPVPPTSSVTNGYHGTATVPSPASNMQVSSSAISIFLLYVLTKQVLALS